MGLSAFNAMRARKRKEAELLAANGNSAETEKPVANENLTTESTSAEATVEENSAVAETEKPVEKTKKKG